MHVPVEVALSFFGTAQVIVCVYMCTCSTCIYVYIWHKQKANTLTGSDLKDKHNKLRDN